MSTRQLTCEHCGAPVAKLSPYGYRWYVRWPGYVAHAAPTWREHLVLLCDRSVDVAGEDARMGYTVKCACQGLPWWWAPTTAFLLLLVLGEVLVISLRLLVARDWPEIWWDLGMACVLTPVLWRRLRPLPRKRAQPADGK